MAQKTVPTNWTRDTRNILEHNYTELYSNYISAGLDATEAREKALSAVMKSDEAMALSERTQKELSQAILEGDSSPLGGQLSVGADGTTYSNPQERFVKEMNSVNQNLAQIAKPIVVPTFDDGYAEDDLTYSILKEYGFVGSFGLITDQLYGASKNSLNKYNQYEKEGFEVLSHSATHASLTSGVTPDSEKYREMQSSADKLRGLGFSTNGFVVPYSNISTVNRKYAEGIYDYILIGGTGLNGKNDFKNKTLSRVSQYNSGVETSKALIDQAIAEKKLLIFYDHRIGQSGSLTEAEFREILDYLKTKVSEGLIEVHNLKNAVSKYYGISVEDKTKIRSTDNLLPSLASTAWELANNTVGATESIDATYAEPVRSIMVPANAPVGTTVSFRNKYTLPASFVTLGERADFHFSVQMSNSQYDYFRKYVDLELLGSTDNVLFSKTIEFFSNNTTMELQAESLFNEAGISISDVKKINAVFRFEVTTSPTVSHFIRIFSAKLIFPNSNYTPKIEEGFSARKISGAQTVTSSSHTIILFDEVEYNNNFSYNPSTGYFTAKQAGIYLINASVRWASMIDNTRLIVAAFLGSTQNKSIETRGVGTSSQAVALTTMIRLSKGDSLAIRAFQDSGGSLDVSIGNYTWANVHLLSS